MENCNHNFLKLKEVTRSTESMTFINGLLCLCPLCGESRKVWEDGEIEIKNNEG